jgi:hypothetical protein
MSESHHTRRQVLRRFGTASTTAIAAVSGCLASRSTDTRKTPESTPTATPTPPTDTPSKTVDPEAWTMYGTKPYAELAPQPSEIGRSAYNLTSTLPAAAVHHGAAFDDGKRWFARRWLKAPPGAGPNTTHLNIWVDNTLCIGGVFDPARVVDRLESFSFEKLDSYQGFDLYAGTTSGITLQVIGLSDEWFLMDFPTEIPKGKQNIQSLIDLYQGEATPYYRTSDALAGVVEYLPQGVFTRVYPKVSAMNLRLKKRIKAAGEALLFDDQQNTATGVNVLKLYDDIDNPRQTVRESYDIVTRFMDLTIQNPDLRIPTDQTVVLNGPLKPTKQ